MQADRGLNTEHSGPEAWTLPLAEVSGVPLPTHPWADMQARLGEEPTIEALASRVPADMLYAHLHDLRTAVSLRIGSPKGVFGRR